MISFMALLDRYYIKQTTVSRGNAVIEKSISSVPFFRLFPPYFFAQTSSYTCKNVGSVRSYGTNSWHTIPCTSKLTSVSISHRNKLLYLLQAGRSHAVICNDLWKEVWMSDVSSECPGMHWCNSVSAHQTMYKAEILTQSTTNSVLCQTLTAQTKKVPNSLANLWIVIHLLSCQIPYICSTFLYILPEGRHPEYSVSVTDVIPLLDSAEQSNTTDCLIASSLKANVNIWKVSATILPICNNNLMHMHCSLNSVIFWKNKNCTGHNKWSHFAATHGTTKSTTNNHAGSTSPPHRWWFCPNCSSCSGQGVTGDTLTLQGKDLNADQYRSLPMVVEKCPSEQTLWDIFLVTETFVFYIQFLQNSIQYTTNNFPNITWVEFNF